MAKFNPDVQETTPTSYLGLSQPISPLKNYSTNSGPDVTVDDKSSGMLLQGIGNLFEGVVKAGETIVEKTIKDELYKSIDKKREGYTSDLEKAGNIPQVQRVADVAGNQLPQPLQSTSNILPDRPEGPLPTELARLPDTLGNLQSASGKLSPTYYTGRLDLIAKDLRTRFPGFRDYIDKQVESITGENPANAYIKQLLHQINENQTSSKSEREKMIAYVHQNDNLEGASLKMQDVVSGKATWSGLVGWAGSIKAPREQLRADHAEFEAAKDNLEKQKIIAEDALVSYGQKKFPTFWKNTTDAAGLTAEKITENAHKVQRGEEVQGMGDDPAGTAVTWSQSISAAESAARQDLIRQANIVGPSGRSMAQALGPEKLEKLITSILTPYSDTKNLLTGKSIAMAAATAEMNKAIQDSAEKRLYADPQLGGAARTYVTINKLFGPNASQFVIEKAYANGLDGKLKRRLDFETSQIANPELNQTIRKAIDDAAGVGIGAPDLNDPTKPANPEHMTYYKELLAKNRFIGDKNISLPNQQKLGKAFYGPGNEGTISKFSEDTHDPVTGQYLEGKIDVFRRLYGTQSVIKGMKTLGEYDGQSWDMFKTSADRAFVNEVFTTEIKNMETYQKSPLVKIIYHDNTQTFEIKNSAYQNRYGGGGFTTDAAQQSVDRLNKGFQAMVAIAKEDGKDPNAYVLGTMIQLGLDPKKVEGIGPELLRAVLASKPAAVDPFNTKNEKKSQARVGQ